MAKQTLLVSIKRAFSGLFRAFKEERNLQIHLLATVFILLLSWFFKIQVWELIVVLFLCFGVIILELLNTIFEKVVDFMKPQMHTYVHVVKDMMAAVVLVAAIGAVLVGALIFLPYIIDFVCS